MAQPHPSHPEVLRRLRRAAGHLDSVIGMIEQERSCADVGQQMQAVISALVNARKMFIQDHIEHCIQAGFEEEDADVPTLIDELKKVSKYL